MFSGGVMAMNLEKQSNINLQVGFLLYIDFYKVK